MKISTINLLSNLKEFNSKNSSSFLNKSNKHSRKCLNQLKKAGYILSFYSYYNRNNVSISRIFLKKGFNNKKAFNNIYFFSKTGKYVFVNYEELLHLQNSVFSGLIFLETSQYGILSHTDAFKKGVGGKLLLALI